MPEAPPEQPWPMSVLVQLGKQLAEVLVRAVQMPSSLAAPRGPSTLIPVLYHVYSFRSFRQVLLQWCFSALEGGGGAPGAVGHWDPAVAPDPEDLDSGSWRLRGPWGFPSLPPVHPDFLACPAPRSGS